MFCPKCGSLLVPKKEGNKIKIVCPSCGYEDKSQTNKVVKIKEEIRPKEEIEIIEPEKEQNLPIVDANCEKCGNKKAYFWTLQTRAADEAETKFFKCTKCGHTWRDYD